MKVHKRKFLELVSKECESLLLFCVEFGITLSELNQMLGRRIPFEYEQAKLLVRLFGAEAMARVIDWEGMNVRCPI